MLILRKGVRFAHCKARKLIPVAIRLELL